MDAAGAATGSGSAGAKLVNMFPIPLAIALDASFSAAGSIVLAKFPISA